MPLLGASRFYAGDIVLNYAPWSEEIAQNRTGNAPQSDFVDVSIGGLVESRSRVLDGDFPEWSPEVAAGGPLIVTPSGGRFSPIALPGALLPAELAPAYVKLVELLVVVTGFHLLCRELGLRTQAGLLAGTVYAFSGFQNMFSTWSQSLTGAMVPWLFWAAERAVRRRCLIDVVPLALTVAVLVLGGFPAVAAYALYCLSAYLVLRALVGLIARFWRDSAARGRAARRWLAEHLRGAILLAAGTALGVGLVAVLLVPFFEMLSDEVLPSRSRYGTVPMPRKAVATLAFPHAFGVLNRTTWFGPLNPIEAVGYVGTGALILALVGVVAAWRRRGDLAIVLPALVVLSFVAWAVYLGGPPLELLGELPGIASSPIGRMRSVIAFFVALLAAVGVHGLLDQRRGPGWPERAFAVVVAAIAGGVTVAKIREFADINGQLDAIWGWMLVSIAVGAVMAALILVPRNVLPRWVLGSALLVVVSVEALAFVRPYYPRVANELAMPSTSLHEHVLDAQDEQSRLAAHRTTMLPGTTRYYGIESLTGHAFHSADMKRLLLDLDPAVFDASPTYSFLDLADRARLTSPILDRAAVGRAVLPLDVPVVGSRNGVTHPTEPAGGARSASGIDGGPLRGFDLWVTDAIEFPGGPDAEADLVTEIRQSGRLVASTDRRFRGAIAAGVHAVGVAGEDLTPVPLEVTLRLEDLDGNDIALPAGPGIELDAVRPAEDGLRVERVDGAVLWQRTEALPRIRWASDAVAANGDEDLELLASGRLRPHEVVIPAPQLGDVPEVGGPGEVIDFDRNDPDRFHVDVRSKDGGWLVVADALRDGWTASVDGLPAPLLDADVAFATVRVPAGSHRVVFDYQAPGTDLGRLVTGISVVILMGLLAWIRRGRVRSRFGLGREDP